MPTVTLLNLAILAIVYAIYSFLSNLYRSRRFAQFAASHGASEAPDYTKPFPVNLIDPVIRLREFGNIIRSGGDLFEDIVTPEFSKHNTLQRWGLGSLPNLGTVEPANLQAMIATQFDDFEVGRPRYNQFSPLLGKSIFTTDGSFWQHSRALLRPQFNRDNINNLETTNAASLALIEAIGPTDADNWTKETDLLPLIYNFTLDTTTEFLFGESVGSQAVAIQKQRQQQGLAPSQHASAPSSTSLISDQASSEQFMSDFTLASEKVIHRIQMQDFYYLSDSFAFRRAVANLKRFTSTFVSHAISQASGGSPSSAESKTQKYSFLTSLATQTSDPSQLRNQALAILVAGRDTTASLLSWSLVRLALHPEIFSSLRRTVVERFGTFPAEGEEKGDLDFAKLKDCRPLQHFFNEVLRLHPPVPVNNRIAAKDTTLPVGGGEDGNGKLAVRKGQVVMFSVYVLHRRKDLWGEDALEFKPERWERKIAAWQFLPFHGGPRTCLGQQYALTEAAYLLVRILQRFDAIEPVDRERMAKFKKGYGLSMWPGEGVPVRLHKAT